jgi:hypothetical protein
MIDTLEAALDSGEVSEARVAEANRRLTTLLERYYAPARDFADLSVLASPEHVAIADRLKAALKEVVSSPDPTEGVVRHSSKAGV